MRVRAGERCRIAAAGSERKEWTMADTSVSYKCPNCEGPLNFAPGAGSVTCEYCGSKFTVQELEALYGAKEQKAAEAAEKKDAKWNAAAAGGMWSEEEAAMLRAYTCSSCGAEIVCDENTMATECCYCGNPTMLPGRFSGMLKPDYVIPFKKTKEEAVAALKKFYEGKKVLPDAFTENNRVEQIQAMYVPFWLFSSELEAFAVFDAQNESAVTSGKETITTTDIYRCYRNGKMSFYHVPVDGSVKMDDTYMESIEPFDYSEMVPFSSAYMTGFLADKYDVDAQTATERADDRMQLSAAGCLEETVTGYSSVSAKQCDVLKTSADVKYAMAPVWILTTRYENQPYTFMMNGQTGKFIGRLPVDKKKLYIRSLGPAVVALPLLYFAGKWLINMLFG